MTLASQEFIRAIIREFKALYPATKDVEVVVNFVPEIVQEGKRLKGSFNTELDTWDSNFRYGLIDISERYHSNQDDVGVTLVHELMHCWFKKMAGLHAMVEELMCEHSDRKVYEYIRKRLSVAMSV